MTNCSVDGCSRSVRARGWCGAHYERWRKHGTLADPVVRTPEERFWEKVRKTDSCWIWTAANLRGYGVFGSGPDRAYAHRFSYALENGPIPNGYEIDHICHNPSCVKPSHLRPVTRKQNVENRAGARRDNPTGLRGISRTPGGRWRARVRNMNRDIWVGVFDTPEEAQAAVVAKRNELFTHNDMDRTG